MSLLTPEFGLAFWMLVIFLILLGILGRFAWPGIIGNLEERADFIDQGVLYTREADEDRKRAREEAKAMLDEVHKKQLEVLQETERMKREIIEEAKRSATKEAKRIIDSARVSIEQEKRESELQLRKKVGMLSLEIAEKVIRKRLAGEQEQMELINRLLNEAEHKE